jgi:endoglucanase
MNTRLAELFERAGDGDLDPAQDAELRALLADNGARAAVIEQRRIALLLAACWDERSPAMIGALARSAATVQRPSRIHLRIRARSARRRRFGIDWNMGRVLVAAAALMLAILGGRAWWQQPGDLPLIAAGTVTTSAGLQLAAGQSVPAGALVRNESSVEARLSWRDGTHIELAAGTTLEVAVGKQLRLEQGAIHCVVARQPEAQPLRVRTLQAETRVVGTEFTVTINASVTRLAVASGTVLFTDLANQRVITVTGGGAASAGDQALPPALARGINLLVTDSNGGAWPADARGLRQLDAIAAAGFSFVRVVIPGKRRSAAEGLERGTLAALDALLDAIAARGLACMVTPYPLEDTDPATARLDQQRVWPALAAHLAGRPAERMFFELSNDPRQMAAERRAQVAALVAAIRRPAPAHTLVIDTHMGLSGSAEALEAVLPVAESGIIYAVRFFEPVLFTHQGGGWIGEPYDKVASVPYPSDPQAVAAAVARTPAAQEALARYGAERWNAARIDALLATVAAWGERNHAAVVVTNFAAVAAASADARSAWMRDVRTACEHHRLGWSLWQDSGVFSLWAGPTRDAFDLQTLQALGLRAAGP